MNMQEVAEKAKKVGVKPGKKRKADLIKEIQTAEGNYPCYGSAIDYCDQELCCWRVDCLADMRGKKPASAKKSKPKKAVKRVQKKKVTKLAA